MSINILTADGIPTTLSEEAVSLFRDSLRGQLIAPDDSRYNEARGVWNGMIDRRPALIVRCTGVADVITTVNFARNNRLLVSVRGGGHHVAGNAIADGGLVIDLSPMKGISVDPVARTARAQAGVIWGELDHETQAFGLATPGGVVSDTGIAGLTLGGGLGFLRRKYGLSCDSLISVDVVTADGQLVKASASENADLFWGIKGGGGNFGIVTSFEYQLYPVGPEVMVAFVLYPAEIAKDALRFYRDYAINAPDELSSFAIFGTVPAAPMFPDSAHGAPYILFYAVHCGTVEEGKRAVQPLREFATPLADLSSPMPYVEVQRMLDEDYPAGEMRYYWKSAYVNSLDDEVIDRLLENHAKSKSPHSTTDIWQLGGAMSRVGASESAFGSRAAPFLVGVEANWEHAKEDEMHIAWARAFIRDLEPYSDGAQYLNFPGFYEEGDSAMQTAFGDNYTRLVTLKNKYDPTNLFRLNQNIKPVAP